MENFKFARFRCLRLGMEANGRPQFLPATYSAPVQTSGLHLSACQRESFGRLLPLLASPK